MNRLEAIAAMKHFPRRNYFKKGQCIWVHDATQDEIRSKDYIIKRYVPFNRGKDYKEMKARGFERGASFTIDTNPEVKE